MVDKNLGQNGVDDSERSDSQIQEIEKDRSDSLPEPLPESPVEKAMSEEEIEKQQLVKQINTSVKENKAKEEAEKKMAEKEIKAKAALDEIIGGTSESQLYKELAKEFGEENEFVAIDDNQDNQEPEQIPIAQPKKLSDEIKAAKMKVEQPSEHPPSPQITPDQPKVAPAPDLPLKPRSPQEVKDRYQELLEMVADNDPERVKQLEKEIKQSKMDSLHYMRRVAEKNNDSDLYKKITEEIQLKIYESKVYIRTPEERAKEVDRLIGLLATSGEEEKKKLTEHIEKRYKGKELNVIRSYAVIDNNKKAFREVNEEMHRIYLEEKIAEMQKRGIMTGPEKMKFANLKLILSKINDYTQVQEYLDSYYLTYEEAIKNREEKFKRLADVPWYDKEKLHEFRKYFSSLGAAALVDLSKITGYASVVGAIPTYVVEMLLERFGLGDIHAGVCGYFVGPDFVITDTTRALTVWIPLCSPHVGQSIQDLARLSFNKELKFQSAEEHGAKLREQSLYNKLKKDHQAQREIIKK